VKRISKFLCIGLLTFAFCPAYSQTSLESLKKNKAILEGFLEKIENGRNPCFSDECQSQKSKLIDDIFDQTTALQAHLTPSLKTGIQSARRLIAHRFIPTNSQDKFPESLEEWAYWWKRRSSHENKYRSDWSAFASQVKATREALRFYQRAHTRRPATKKLMQDAWNRGAAKNARLMKESSGLMHLAGQLQRLGLEEEAQKAQEQALLAKDESDKIQKKFRGQIKPLLLKLFRSADYGKLVSALAILDQWPDIYETEAFLDEEIANEVNYFYKQYKNLDQKIQDFNELEYGVVGLKNFHTPVNRLSSSENELIIQEVLDRVDESARSFISIGAMLLLFKSGKILFGQTPLAYSFPSAAFIYAEEKNFDLADQIWSRSYRSEEIRSGMPKLRQLMEHRQTELLKLRKILRKKIKQIDLRLIELQAGG
jgi:hypothetical protein